MGLSQPQLSRLVAKLEEELGMELLDRQVKRKSAWTIDAYKLAEVYDQNQRRLQQSIRELQISGEPTEIHVGTLEGLASEAARNIKLIMDKSSVHTVFLDVYDTDELESKFLAGDLDFILTNRIPTRAKPRHIKTCGYQSVDMIKKGDEFLIYSTFEYSSVRRRRKKNNLENHPYRKGGGGAKTLVSNSLFTRQIWLEKFGDILS